jgi:F-type H+-transporting ATPase subunit a
MSVDLTTTGSLLAAGGPGTSYEGLFVYIGIVVLILFLFLGSAKSGLNNRVFTKWTTQWTEQLYLFIENMTVGIIGAHGRKYIPLMMALWMIIFVSNIVSLFFPTAPTADLSFNLALALISIGYVQWEGMKSNGVLGHFSHFAGPKLGGGLVLISLMIFVIELISEVMKNVSLSLRLFGNIEGGHQAVVAMNELGAAAYIPIGFFLLPVKLLTAVVQALIFTLLTCVYISLVTHHEEEHEHGHGELAGAH